MLSERGQVPKGIYFLAICITCTIVLLAKCKPQTSPDSSPKYRETPSTSWGHFCSEPQVSAHIFLMPKPTTLCHSWIFLASDLILTPHPQFALLCIMWTLTLADWVSRHPQKPVRSHGNGLEVRGKGKRGGPPPPLYLRPYLQRRGPLCPGLAWFHSLPPPHAPSA